MTRQEKVAKHFQKKHLLTVENKDYADQLYNLVDWMVHADVVSNDITTKTLGLSEELTADIFCKQEGVVSGIEEINYILNKKTHISVVKHVTDGNYVKKGDVLLRLSGNATELLGFERIILNIIGRMCGIATYTAEFISLLKNVTNSPLLVSTRKTPWMLLDKKAVCVGGGGTHRLSLSDFALVKDTHLFAYAHSSKHNDAICDVVQKMMAKGDFFEIEVANTKQADVVIDVLEKANYKGAAIMLDNVTPKITQEFMQAFKNNLFYEHIYIEASGEVTKENILDWAKTGVDVISSGTLTHSAPTCNISMRLQGLAF